MERSKIIEAVRRSAERLGYIFYTGHEAVLAARVSEMPSVGLLPPSLKEAKGQNECRDVYSMKIRFMMLPPSPDPADIAEAVSLLQTDARVLIEEVKQLAWVRGIKGIRVVHESRPLTPRGEIGVTAECEMEVCYNRY